MYIFNKLNSLINKNNLINIVCILYIISLILDLHLFYNSISTLIRVFFITILFIIIFIKYASNKEKKLLIIYFILTLIYIVIHLLYASSFKINFYLQYDTLNEILYFIKMFMNIFLIFLIYKLELDEKRFIKTIKASAFLIAFSIVICNFLKIGYTAYDFSQLKYSLFDWFTNKNISFLETSSKGYFHLTNQIVAILTLYLPILMIDLIKKINISTIITILLTILSLFMLGTRVSTYSVFIILIISLIVYIITSLIDKKLSITKTISIILLLGLSYGIFCYCPLHNRNHYYDSIFDNVLITDTNNKVNNEFDSNSNSSEVDKITKEEIIYVELSEISHLSNEEFKKYLKNYNIIPEFYEKHYPLEIDLEFYENYVKLNTIEINDTRFLETAIIKRVVSLHDNAFDSVLGIGYDRIMNIFNIEKDYVMQHYSLGIVGLLLITLINIYLLIYIYFKVLFRLDKYFKFDIIMLLFTCSYFMITAYFTGNILNSLSTLIPISFVLGYLLSRIKKDKLTANEYYLGFKTSTKNKESILKDIFSSNKQSIIYNINPLIINNFYQNPEVVKEFNKSDVNIPDGNGIVLLSKLMGKNIQESIPGIELFYDICRESIKHDYKIYLYGAKEDVVSKTKSNLEDTYQGINIVGYKNGYTNELEVLNDIESKDIDILFVAMGSPLQENFIIKNKKKLKNIKIIMPVGGSFDVVSKRVSRAPKIARKLKLEWLYRMLKEPTRFLQLFKIIKVLVLVLLLNFWYNEEK